MRHRDRTRPRTRLLGLALGGACVGVVLGGVAAGVAGAAAGGWSSSTRIAGGAQEFVVAVGASGTTVAAWTETRSFLEEKTRPARVHVRLVGAGGALSAERFVGNAGALGGATVLPDGTAAIFTERNARQPESYQWVARSDAGWRRLGERGEDREVLQLLALRDGRLITVAAGDERSDELPVRCVVTTAAIGGCVGMELPNVLDGSGVVEADGGLLGIGDLAQPNLRSAAYWAPLLGRRGATATSLGVLSTDSEESDVDARGGGIAWVGISSLTGVYYAVGRGRTLGAARKLPWAPSRQSTALHVVADRSGGATVAWIRAMGDSETGRPHWARIAPDGSVTAHGAFDTSVAVDELDVASVGGRVVAVWRVGRRVSRLRSAELTSAGPRRLQFSRNQPEIATRSGYDREWALSAAGGHAALLRRVRAGNALLLTTLER
jgi:hypothetical protein